MSFVDLKRVMDFDFGNTIVALPGDRLNCVTVGAAAIPTGSTLRLPAGTHARVTLPTDVPVPIKR